MRILFATSEIVPLIKTGGLADVSAALPQALHEIGVDVHVLVPGYPQVLKALPSLRSVAELHVLHGFPETRLMEGKLPSGVPLWVIDCPELYQRGGGPYQDEHGLNWMDNSHRFGLLSKVAAMLGSADTPVDWKAEVVHCNDWQTALAPAYLHFTKDGARSVMAIHNLAFQGIFPPRTTVELGLPTECFQVEGAEFYGNLSFLKAGLHYADHITTVSPSYAGEIQTDEMGFGLQGLLASRHATLTGIVNGIDTSEWNPATDHNLARNYDANSLDSKSANKLELQKRMGLRSDPDIPLFGLVSRFTHQKGLDIVLEIAPQLATLPAQLALLGAGDAGMQRAALDLSHRYSGQISAYVGFDESLSHLIEAGADIFLMPSRFEPCGLNQMFSQHYGTPPVVRATGGLKDTVIDCSEEALARDEASGFMFHGANAASLMGAVQRAVTAYRNKKTWRALQLNGMAKDFSWGKSAAAYRDIYAHLIRHESN